MYRDGPAVNGWSETARPSCLAYVRGEGSLQFRNRFGHGFVHGTRRDGLRRRRRGRSETTSWRRPPGATALDASEPPMMSSASVLATLWSAPRSVGT